MGKIHVHNPQKSPKKLEQWRKKGKWGNKGKKKRKLAGQRESLIPTEENQKEKSKESVEKKSIREIIPRFSCQYDAFFWVRGSVLRQQPKQSSETAPIPLPLMIPSSPVCASSDVLRQDAQAQEMAKEEEATPSCHFSVLDHLPNSRKCCRWAEWTATLLRRESWVESQLQEKAGLDQMLLCLFSYSHLFFQEITEPIKLRDNQKGIHMKTHAQIQQECKQAGKRYEKKLGE